MQGEHTDHEICTTPTATHTTRPRTDSEKSSFHSSTPHNPHPHRTHVPSPLPRARRAAQVVQLPHGTGLMTYNNGNEYFGQWWVCARVCGFSGPYKRWWVQPPTTITVSNGNGYIGRWINWTRPGGLLRLVERGTWTRPGLGSAPRRALARRVRLRGQGVERWQAGRVAGRQAGRRGGRQGWLAAWRASTASPAPRPSPLPPSPFPVPLPST